MLLTALATCVGYVVGSAETHRRHLIQIPEPHYLSSLRSSLFSPDDRAPHPIFKREPSHFVGSSFPSLGPQITFFGSLHRVRDNR